MKIVGYGEDSLTLWALTHRTREILDRLGDESDIKDTMMYFRPSFGRRGSTPTNPGSTADSAQFGEFDAILASPKSIYLIEAKWSRSPEFNRGTITLRSEQIRRHQLLRAYLLAWRELENGCNWKDFFDNREGYLIVDEIRYPIAPTGSQLSRNLETILRGLSTFGSDIHDVLLYIRTISGPQLTTVENHGFQLISIECQSEFGFVSLNQD